MCWWRLAPHVTAPQVFFKEASVKQVDVPTLTGAFGILPAHVPTLQVLRPGVVTVFSDDGSSVKYFGETLQIQCGKTYFLYVFYNNNLKTVLRSPTFLSDLHTTYQKQMPFQSFIECVCLIRTFYLIYPKILKSKTSPVEILIMQRWIWAYFCPFFNLAAGIVCKSFCKTLHFFNNVPFCRCWCVLADLLPCVFTQWAVGR